MQVDLPDDSLVRETMACLGPGAKDATPDDVAAWIRQLEGLCDSKDAALAPASFRTDVSGSCLSKFPAFGTSTQIAEMQTKAVKGYPSLPELRMEKVSSKKKNAHGEAKLRLSVECGPALVLLTITDFHGATRTLRAVTVDGNDLIPIKNPATTIEATVIPFTPDQLLERLRLFHAKIKEHRKQPVQPSASPQQSVEEASAQRQAGGVKYWTKRFGRQVIEYMLDPETGTLTTKSSGCSNPNCDEVNCTVAPAIFTYKANGEVDIATDNPSINDDVPLMLKSFRQNPLRHIELSKRVANILKEEKAIKEKFPSAKPAEKKRLLEDLEAKNAEYANLKDLMFRTAGTGGWLRVPEEELAVLLEKAKQKDPESYEALRWRARAALDEYDETKEKLESTSNESKKKRLFTLLGRKEIAAEEVINEIAVIAGGSEQGDDKELNDVSGRMNKASYLNGRDSFDVPKDELTALLEKAMRKDPMRAGLQAVRNLAASKEYTAIEEKLKSTSNPTKKRQLAELLGRKKVECDNGLNEMAVIAGGSEQKESKELYDAFVRADDAEAEKAAGWFGVRKVEICALFKKAEQKDPNCAPTMVNRARAAREEYHEIKKKLESNSNRANKKRLSTLLGRKEIEFNGAMDEIAVIAGGSEQKDIKELYDAFVRADKATAWQQSP